MVKQILPHHRRLKCLVAIDLKLGKFKPKYKGQMELYLKYLQKHDMQEGENPPIGLLLCSEGNTEHIELMMLDEPNIKVSQYPVSLICNSGGESISICNAIKQRYAAAVVRQPYSQTVGL